MVLKKTVRYMINTSLKSVLGLLYHSYVEKAWQLNQISYTRLQQKLFERMYRHAIGNVPYYVERKEQYPLYQGDIHYHRFLNMLPIISKETLRNDNELFVSRQKKRWCTTHTTSGTTGTPLTLYATPLERALSFAVTVNWYRKIAEYQKAFPIIALSGFMTPGKEGELFWSSFGGREIFLNIYGLKPSNADQLASIIAKHPGGMFFGYASALAELARVIAGRLYHDKDKFVAVSTSEVLTPYYRTIIEQHLCRKVYDQYGSQEGCHLAVECDAGYMHVHPHIGIVEVLNEYDKPCLNGELGRVVVTGFKHSMPLIRYDIGDSAIALDGPCPCGLVWPIIGPVAGRSEDLVITPDGRKIGYLNFHSTKNLKGIVESQLIQRGYTSFAFNLVLQPELVSNNEYTSFNESLIIEELQKRLGYHVQVEFAYLKDIPREGGRSKFKAVVVDFVADNN